MRSSSALVCFFLMCFFHVVSNSECTITHLLDDAKLPSDLESGVARELERFVASVEAGGDALNAAGISGGSERALDAETVQGGDDNSDCKWQCVIVYFASFL